MPFYVQYDELGNISATVGSLYAPNCNRQLAFDDYVDTDNKRVNLETLQLEDIPAVPEDDGQG